MPKRAAAERSKTGTMDKINWTNRTKEQKPIGVKTEPNKIGDVDRLLFECDDLIDPAYKKWFAKHFYHLTPQYVLRLASEARVEGLKPKVLFSYKIKQAINQR